MSRLLVLTGIEPEARSLARELWRAGRRGFGGAPTEVVAVGIGASGLEAVLQTRNVRDDTVIVSAGLCGALDPTSTAGALVVPDAVQLPSGALLSVAAALHERALSAVPSGPVIRGVLLSVDRLVSTPALKRELRERTGAVAVDMESGPVLAAAAARGLPALVVRAVADTADDAVSPELASVVDGEGRLRLERAARVALRRPDLLPQALRMALASRRALRSVAAALIGLQRSLAEPQERTEIASKRPASAACIRVVSNAVTAFTRIGVRASDATRADWAPFARLRGRARPSRRRAERNR